MRIAIESFDKVAENRHTFDVSIPYAGEDRLELRACSLVAGRSGGWLMYPPSRWTGEWIELVGMPARLRSDIREAAVRELGQQPTAQVVR